MKKFRYYFNGLILLFLFISCQSVNKKPREIIRFTTDWKFTLSDNQIYKSPDYIDNQWRSLNLPHDWSIEGEFSEDNPATPGGGALPGGIAWYRKTFDADAADSTKKFYIDFDGVYMNSEVYLNGNLLGKRPNGYISFRYDLTPFLNFGTKNTLAVRVDNSEQPNSRWYSGSGIYRNVWLVKTNAIHVAQWGTYITTPAVTKTEATINIETTLENKSKSDASIILITRIIDQHNKEVLRESREIEIHAGDTNQHIQKLDIKNPNLWSTEEPYLYKAISEITQDGILIDQYETNFGIRSFEFTADKGFFLNGKPTKILGVCNHHDLGCLGTAVNKRALERQLEILKKMGCNAIRTSHNPPAPELLQLCDQMGFIVQDETFDMWRKKKSPYDYARYFPDWHERDLTDHIKRDRNHASVFMWSIGNEVLEQWTDANADTLDLKAANLLLNFKRDSSALAQSGNELSVNSLLTQKLARIVRNLDPTRPVTTGNNEPDPNNHIYKANTLDLIGYNYHDQWFDDVSKNFPGKPFIVTESTSGLMTRGYYRMPSDSMFIWPVRWDIPFHDESQACSSYDNCHVPWGTTHEKSWKIVRDRDFISGLFVWTGFDYLGEPTPYWWPSRSSYFGIIDLAGFPKDVYYMYQSEWTDKDVLHILPHWNWEEGQNVDIWAYTNAEEVELFMNGKSLGTKQKSAENLHLMWRVPFESGTLKAVSRTNGHVVLETEVRTAGEPAKIKLTADRSQIKADEYDLSFVTVEVLDKDGNLVPNADNLVHFELEGNATLAGVDNGDQTSHLSFKGSQMNAFHGKCLAVIQASEHAETISLIAKSEGLISSSIQIQLIK
ncbi:glycoside hydrolase family 2 TIM barrel-domain containing protein [Sunxiuqinia indica]|uniref:glycoside hydrolase family 2 TIM barrel-domain containing protein n=1 Tax=Sunxiuqinia indica TaxID=2692584 RepID=UPI00135A4B82|nr:glycoside hydrolase family 2 TIM barrel-domain containing protein [Sunxiuqinia indica]